MILPAELANLAPIDLLAPLWLALLWAGYARITRLERVRARSVMGRMHECRRVWMRQALGHELRMVDVQIVQTLVRSVTFFASTTIFVIAGLLAVLGAREQALRVLSELPLVVETGPLLWDLKVAILLVIFVYAFFKFTWALRLFNYVAIVIGGMPPPARCDDDIEGLMDRSARIATGAGDHFNSGLRAYYFALAYLTWFLHPFAFYAATLWVVLVLWRREFHSKTLKVLRDLGRTG